MRCGRFISFEGGEGSGKTTQIARLAETLRARGHDVVTTREPGGTDGAEAIRKLLLEGDAGRWTGRTEALLMNAARAEHVERLIRPALEAGAWVLTDRYAHSTLAYQGGGRGLESDELIALHFIATAGLWPDLTLLLDIEPEEGLARAGKRLDPNTRFDEETIEFHEEVRDVFRDIADVDERVALINAAADPDGVAGAILAEVEARLNP
ncbi:dTMP kinase [Pacificimonas flava]|uniref:Thymidylate kinase n=1 Tax=Pacificimonas flava TaxID=1234595 RepID=M2U9A0_9SPHN|nr:dTMP kinase [Pacificimonas flava]EMD84547.1 Thymidylate kinase [Pacificimonas flava]MBB5279581.1 dTMP kinase [Pacificimonas flava]